MWLVLCPASDPVGLWAYDGLKQLGLAPVELVTAESLAYARLWEHRVEDSGTHLKITLPDGRVLCSSRIRGALNRLLAPSQVITQLAVASDQAYAQGELLALYLSWLHGLPGVVINRPTPLGLCGAWYHISEWVCRAGRAGLRTPAYRQSGHDGLDRGYRSLAPEGATVLSLITLRGEVFGGRVPENVVRACGKLAEEAGTDMLGIELYLAENGEWTFANAVPCPDLTRGGMPLLQRLTQVFLQEGRP